MQNLDLSFVQSVLPHRPPMLLVDQVIAYEPGKHVHAARTFHASEVWFQGHFPGDPILPGVIILEAMAQAGGFLFVGASSAPQPVGGVVIGFQRAKFKAFVRPNDTLHLHGALLARMGGLAQADFSAHVGDTLVATAQVSYQLALP